MTVPSQAWVDLTVLQPGAAAVDDRGTMTTHRTLMGARAAPQPTANELAVLEALATASEAFVTGTRRLEPVLNGLLASILHLAQADEGSVMLLSADGQSLKVVAARGPRANQIIGLSQPVEQSVSGWVLREDQTLVLEGRSDRVQATAEDQPISAHPRDLASSVVMPLAVRKRMLGVLSASRAPGTPRIGERTVHLLELLASQAAILIDTAQLAERETATLRERAQLLDLAFDAVLVRDLVSGRVSFWNPGAEALYGWTTEAARGQVLHTTLDTRFPEPLQAIERQLTQVGNWQGELTQRRQDGGLVVVSSRWALQRDSAGRAVAVLEINRDITRQTQAAAQLQETHHELQRQYEDASVARSRVQAVLDATSEAIALLSADNTTLSVNKRFGELFLADANRADEAYPYQHFVLNSEHLFDHASNFDAVLTHTMLVPDAEIRQTIVQAWPERRELDLYSTPVRDIHGLRLGRLFVFRDVTAERAAERAKTEFVSMISHELRTPLTSINGYVDLLLDEELGNLNADQLNSLRIVRRNGDHLLALITDLLDVTRMMSGTIRLNFQVIDLTEIINAAADTLRPHVAAKAQHLTVQVPPALRRLRGDAQRLRQVFVNLLSNAHKYTGIGGHVRLNVRDLGHAIVIDVQDSGVGMTAAEQAQLFTKFFRADNEVTRQAGGTGLGLVITRSLIEMHGGAISVSSTPGQGSTFSVQLPVAYAAEPSHVPAPTGELDDQSVFTLLEIDKPTSGARVASHGRYARLARDGHSSHSALGHPSLSKWHESADDQHERCADSCAQE